MSTRTERKQQRRELATWLRENGITPTGAAWDAATAGERNLDTLEALNLADGAPAKRLPDGTRLAAAIKPGDVLPGVGVAVTAPLVDCEDGRLWVTIRNESAALEDVSYGARESVDLHRPRRSWLSDAAEDYQSAREYWERQAESDRPAPISVPGAENAGVAMYQLDRATYAEHVPAPKWADYVRMHADARREVSA